MNLRRITSALSAAVMAVTCTYIPQANVLDRVFAEDEYKDDADSPIFIPDFPQEVLDEFSIDWTGLGCNRTVENTEYDADKSHNKLQYDGGYAMYANQSFIRNFCYVAYWHECNNFTMYQSKEFPFPEYADKLDLTMNMYMHCELKQEGELKIGPLLELNSGREELFVVESFTESTDFSAYEKLGSYSSDDKTYELYKAGDSSAEEAPVRYYAVNTEGLVNVTDSQSQPPSDLTSHISDHLSKLHELAGTETRLDKYGMLTEGKKGVGYVYHDDKLVSSYITLPEEKLSYDENSEPVTYDSNFVKNIEGWRYSFQTSNADWPIKVLEDGRYEHIPHENNSKMIPLGGGKFHAEVSDGITSAVSVGKEFDGTSSVLDHNYIFSYKYKATEKICPAASVWLVDDDVRVEFQEKSRAQYLDNNYYIGNIELDGELYEVYSQISIDYDIAPHLESGFKEFYIIHVDDKSEDETEIRSSSFPISALIEAAQIYGLKAGKLARISLVCNSYLAGYSVDVLEANITEAETASKGSIFTDVKKYYDTKIDPYCFNASTGGYMHGYENGLFNAEAKDTQWSSFSAGWRVPDGEHFIINSYNNIKAEYKLENDLEDKYEIGYSLYCYSGMKNIDITIIENSKNYSVDYNFHKEDLDRKLGSYVKTYTAGGHEYDLYSYMNEYHGCFGVNYYENYVSVRKDQDDGRILEGSVDIAEHISEVNAGFFGSAYVFRFDLMAETCPVNGSLKALKNEIILDKKEVPEVVIGDFNNDSLVNSMDVVSARKALVEKLSDEKAAAPENMDLNRNGSFEIADVVLLQSFVLGKIKAFPQAE